jgi:hypothetical protein
VELFHEGLAEATSEGQAVMRDRKETVRLWAGELGRERLVLVEGAARIGRRAEPRRGPGM